MRQWTSRNRILNSKPFLLELISTQLIHTHSNTPTCLMPADSEKPCSPVSQLPPSPIPGNSQDHYEHTEGEAVAFQEART